MTRKHKTADVTDLTKCPKIHCTLIAKNSQVVRKVRSTFPLEYA